jgi:hypothetical protein
VTDDSTGFRAQPRRAADREASRQRLLAELARLRSRLERAARNGRDDFLLAESDSHDIGALAIINLADLVVRELPDHIVATLPERIVEGLRATRNIAAHNYAALDNSRLWMTVTVHAPALIDDIEAALRGE